MSFIDRIKPASFTSRKPSLLFLITVAIPTTLSTIYYGFLASDIYVSESRFVVRSPDKPAVNGLGLLMKTTGFSTSGDEIYATNDFLVSRDALQAVNRNNVFDKAFERPEISILDRFGGLSLDKSFEALYKYYRNKVSVTYDSSSSITTLQVRAFNPQDAQHFNEQLLGMAEDTVNRMSERGRRDLTNVAEAEVAEAKTKVQSAAVALAEYRNREGLIDPEKQAGIQMQMISKLQDELIATQTQLVELRSLAPANPQIPVLRTRVTELNRAIDEQARQVAGNKKSLAGSAVQYQRLSLESQFAEKKLASALASREEALSEARRKRAYVERVVQPNLPDYPLEPHRVKSIFTTLILGLFAWGILSMLLAGMLEHQD